MGKSQQTAQDFHSSGGLSSLRPRSGNLLPLKQRQVLDMISAMKSMNANQIQHLFATSPVVSRIPDPTRTMLVDLVEQARKPKNELQAAITKLVNSIPDNPDVEALYFSYQYQAIELFRDRVMSVWDPEPDHDPYREAKRIIRLYSEHVRNREAIPQTLLDDIFTMRTLEEVELDDEISEQELTLHCRIDGLSGFLVSLNEGDHITAHNYFGEALMEVYVDPWDVEFNVLAGAVASCGQD